MVEIPNGEPTLVTHIGSMSFWNLDLNQCALCSILSFNLLSVMLGLVPLNPIVWCYVLHYVWHDVWLNIVINKVVLLLSEIMVTFGNYHIVHEMHSVWFMWKVTEDINHKFFVNSEY